MLLNSHILPRCFFDFHRKIGVLFVFNRDQCMNFNQYVDKHSSDHYLQTKGKSKDCDYYENRHFQNRIYHQNDRLPSI